MKRNIKKGISLLVALAMTLTSASVVFADSELVTSVKYKDGFVTVTGKTDNANEAVDIFLLNPEKTKAALGTADTTAEYKETVNFSDVIYSDAAKAFEITFKINNHNEEESYLLYVQSESGEEYEKKISLNDIYVAANGSDETGDGSKNKPFKTIAKAQEAARAALKGTATNIIIGEGTYNIAEGLAFTAEDSGTAEAPVTYKAAEGAEVVVSGSKKISMDKISPLTEEDSEIIDRLPASVANKVVKVDLSELDDTVTGYASNWDPTERIKPMGVYLNDDYQEISRWPNIGYVTIENRNIEGPNDSKGTTTSTDYAKIIIDGLEYSKITNWQDRDNVFIDGYIGNQWFVESAKMGEVKENETIDIYSEKNPEQKVGTATGTTIQLPHVTEYGVDAGGRVVLKNILEEIDSPGEWYVDGKTMYYYPPHTLTDEDTLEITTLTQNFVTIDGASNLSIEGITFEKNSNAGSGNGIEIKNGGNNITIKDCVMKDLGAWGIYHTSATNVTIDGCVMNNLGEGGIYSSSGSSATLTSGNTVIQNCHISDIARDYQANSVAAVTIGGDGTVVKNNTFHNMKNSAIRYSGTNHLFKENEIFNAVNDASDAGAIYSGRSLVEYGSKILNNYLYHIGGRSTLQTENPIAGIFWDDNDSGETATGNIIVTSTTVTGATGIHIAGGADIKVTDNIFVNTSNTEPVKETSGPYAVRANRDYRTEIEGGTYWKDASTKGAFITFKNAMNFSNIATSVEEHDLDKDGTVSDAEKILAAKDTDWKEAYRSFPNGTGNVKSMFDAIKAKKYQKRNTYKDNFSYNAYDMLTENMKPAEGWDALVGKGDSTSTYVESVELSSKSAFAQEKEYDYRLKDAQGTDAITSATPLSTFGAKANGYEIAAEEKEFDLVFPAKKATVLGTSTYIKWEKVNVADEYIVKYSKNADLSDATEITTTDTMVELTGLDENTTYYWSVEAVNLSFNIGGTYACKENGEFKTATYEFTSPAYDETTQNITVEYVNAGTAAIEDVNFIAAVKVGGKLMSSAVSVQDVAVSNDGTITIPASTLTNLADEGAVLELYIWDKGMKSLTGKMLLDI